MFDDIHSTALESAVSNPSIYLIVSLLIAKIQGLLKVNMNKPMLLCDALQREESCESV